MREPSEGEEPGMTEVAGWVVETGTDMGKIIGVRGPGRGVGGLDSWI